MSNWLALINGGTVTVFGCLLAVSFCAIRFGRRNRLILGGGLLLLLLFQGGMYALVGAEVLRQIYPLVAHLPLLLLLYLLTPKRLWPVIAILLAYLCCELRRWLGLLAVALLNGVGVTQDMAELAVTLPLLWLFLRFVSPVVRSLTAGSFKEQLPFGILPLVYYLFDYAVCVYTNLLHRGTFLATEFMPFVCCAAYLVFLVYNAATGQAKQQLLQERQVMRLQLGQAVREMDALRESQELTRRYRHDLRHHLQYVSNCIENGQGEQAQVYIRGICREVEAQQVTRYCRNETVNLILSAFARRGEKAGVTLTVEGSLPPSERVQDSDLCVLLSNALENALHACAPLTATAPCTVSVQLCQRAGRLFLQVTNPCDTSVRFENGVPLAERPEHGIGVQSICAIVRKYDGLYTFQVEQGRFVLRVSL